MPKAALNFDKYATYLKTKVIPNPLYRMFPATVKTKLVDIIQEMENNSDVNVDAGFAFDKYLNHIDLTLKNPMLYMETLMKYDKVVEEALRDVNKKRILSFLYFLEIWSGVIFFYYFLYKSKDGVYTNPAVTKMLKLMKAMQGFTASYETMLKEPDRVDRFFTNIQTKNGANSMVALVGLIQVARKFL